MKRKWIIVGIVLIFVIIAAIIIIRVLKKDKINENVTLRQKIGRNIQIIKG